MPDPISSLKNILTDPAGGPSGRSQGGPAFGTQDMPGSSVKPWLDYPLEALQGALGVGVHTPANTVGALATASMPLVGGIKSALMGGGEEALSGLKGALPESFGPNAWAGPPHTPSAFPDAVSDPLHLGLGAGTRLTPGGNIPLPPVGTGGLGDVPFMKPYPMPPQDITNLPSPSTPPSSGDFPHLFTPSTNIPTSSTHRTAMGLSNPYTATPAYDWPGMEDKSGSTQQYDLHGGPPKGLDRSTVGVDTLNRLGIKVPYGPPPR